MNSDQFLRTGQIGQFSGIPVPNGTVIHGVDGKLRIYTQGEWKPLEYDWVIGKDGVPFRVVPPMPGDQGDWDDDEPMPERWHFEGF